MKTLASLFGGALTLTEQGGIVSLNFNESLAVGSAKGAIQGSGSIQLNAFLFLQLAEAAINKALPSSVAPLIEAAENVANAAVQALE